MTAAGFAHTRKWQQTWQTSRSPSWTYRTKRSSFFIRAVILCSASLRHCSRHFCSVSKLFATLTSGLTDSIGRPLHPTNKSLHQGATFRFYRFNVHQLCVKHQRRVGRNLAWVSKYVYGGRAFHSPLEVFCLGQNRTNHILHIWWFMNFSSLPNLFAGSPTFWSP